MSDSGTVYYPLKLPHLVVEPDGAYVGEAYQVDMNDVARSLVASFDGRTPFRHSFDQLPPDSLPEQIRDYIIWLDEPLTTTMDRSETVDSVMVLSPHPDVGLLSMGGYLLKHRGRIDCTLVSCFSRLAMTVMPDEFSTEKLVSAVRADEARLGARILGSRLLTFGYPALEIRECANPPEMFVEKEQQTDTMLKQALYRLIKEVNPRQIFAPAGFGEHADNLLLHRIALDFFKKDYFPFIEYHFYEDFPHSGNYLNVDEFLSRFGSNYAEAESWVEDISSTLDRKCQLVEIFRSLFGGDEMSTMRRVAARNRLFSPEGGDTALAFERFWKLNDLPQQSQSD